VAPGTALHEKVKLLPDIECFNVVGGPSGGGLVVALTIDDFGLSPLLFTAVMA
jgi:hypothetical protein